MLLIVPGRDYEFSESQAFCAIRITGIEDIGKSWGKNVFIFIKLSYFHVAPTKTRLLKVMNCFTDANLYGCQYNAKDIQKDCDAFLM